jgi:sulfonate transport system substrate-binding protein
MAIARRHLIASVGAVAAGMSMPAIVRSASAATSRIRLVVGTQDIGLQQTVIASKVLDGAPFDLQWAVLQGPAAQLSGLYSKAIDVGLMGDTSLNIEQGRAKFDWTEDTAPLQIVAGWKNINPAFPATLTAARTSANVSTLADLRGKKWAYNFGGYNYVEYLLSVAKAGLTLKDIQPVQLTDGYATAAAFNAGRVDLYSGQPGPIMQSLQSGKGRVLLISDDLDIPGLTTFAARRDVIQDYDKSVALWDFLNRVRQHWTWYSHNLDAVQKIYVEKLDQTPDLAKYSAAYGESRFRPLGDRLMRSEQKVADVLFHNGAIPKHVQVEVEFSDKFNTATVPEF